MADEMPRADEVTNLTPEQVAAGLREGRILLVDVREPNETSVESYPEAVDRAAIVLRSGRNPRPAGEAGRVRLPIGQALRYGLGCRPGCRLSVQRPPCRRYHCVEGGRSSDQGLNHTDLRDSMHRA